MPIQGVAIQESQLNNKASKPQGKLISMSQDFRHGKNFSMGEEELKSYCDSEVGQNLNSSSSLDKGNNGHKQVLSLAMNQDLKASNSQNGSSFSNGSSFGNYSFHQASQAAIQADMNQVGLDYSKSRQRRPQNQIINTGSQPDLAQYQAMN